MAETTNVGARKDGQLVAYDDNGEPISYIIACDTNYPEPNGKIQDKGNKIVDNAGARNREIVKIAAYNGGYPEKERGQEKE